MPGKQFSRTLNKVEGKEQKINEEILSKVYKKIPKNIDSARSQSPLYNSNSNFTNLSLCSFGGAGGMGPGDQS